MDGWVHDVRVRRSRRVRGGKGAGQAVPDEQDQAAGGHAADHTCGEMDSDGWLAAVSFAHLRIAKRYYEMT